MVLNGRAYGTRLRYVVVYGSIWQYVAVHGCDMAEMCVSWLELDSNMRLRWPQRFERDHSNHLARVPSAPWVPGIWVNQLKYQPSGRTSGLSLVWACSAATCCARAPAAVTWDLIR